MTLMVSDRQSESPLDSVRNSCDVFDSHPFLLFAPAYLSVSKDQGGANRVNLSEDYMKETSGAHPKI